LGYLLRQRKVLGLVAGFFGYNYCFYLLLYWMPTYFSALKLDPYTSVLYTSVPWLFATATDLCIGGWLVDALVQRGHKETLVRQTVLIAGTAFGLAIAGAMSTRNPTVGLIWISLSLGGLSAAAPVGWSVPSLIAPRDSVGRVGGILNFGNQIAGISAPIATGYLAGRSNSFSAAFAVAACLLVLGIASYIFLLGKIEPVPEPGNEERTPRTGTGFDARS
jgi:MFS family permease